MFTLRVTPRLPWVETTIAKLFPCLEPSSQTGRPVSMTPRPMFLWTVAAGYVVSAVLMEPKASRSLLT